MAPAPAVTYAAQAPVFGYVAPAPAVTYAAPAPVIEYVAPATVIVYIAPAPAVTLSVPSQQLRPAYTAASVATGVNLDVNGMVSPHFSRTAVEGSASQVVGLLPLGEVFAAPVFNQVHQEQLAGGEIPETLPPAEEFTEPVYNPVHQEQFSAGDTTENFAIFPVVQEQVISFRLFLVLLVHLLPLTSLLPTSRGGHYLLSRAQRHIVEDLGELAPLVQILDLPVPQMVASVTDILRLLDRPIAEQAIAVPTVSCSSRPLRSRDPEPQSADQLVEVPTVLTPTRIALQIAERIADTPVPRGRVHGSLPGQSSAMSLPESVEWVEFTDANGRIYFWNRRTNASVWTTPPVVREGMRLVGSGSGTGLPVSPLTLSLLFLLSEQLHRQPRAVYKYWAPCRACLSRRPFVPDSHLFAVPLV